ncbi:hypothetical protein K431DRAFT_281266 [Polychaeton citri CBS 116435]|uniref:WD40 repeat-like protein n=1 Tax=Polychaeton citri CBS 116435 TaxID=1314669 RepID=A0A9P4UU10_9PEZI|nr:hypothetical protein K431DRAFT_281266 [Polychaeton citri CBS 116435]
MPKILSRTPPWLLPLFQASSPQSQATPSGPTQRLAHRGTEVFAAVGEREIRWSDLNILQYNHNDTGEEQIQPYRLLQTPVVHPIKQLSVSPSGAFIAVCTEHTIHVCVLPSPSLLRSPDNAPVKPRSFQVGPTAHVLDQSALVSVLWHPLGPDGHTLVTVSKDACCRMWELDSNSRNTFSEPALAVDLKKLANASTSHGDFSASKFGTNAGFGLAVAEMEVAAACFGGYGTDEEHGWASMTLWIAMTEGDVYALCPFLPSKWRAPSTLLPSLSTSVVAKARAVSNDVSASESEKRCSDHQTRWLADVDSQEPFTTPLAEGYEIEIYDRPQRPGIVPRIQGPFNVTPELDFGEITDIRVVGQKIDAEALFGEDDEEALEQFSEGVSVGVICLASSASKVYVCLDLDNVEAEWLPSKRSQGYGINEEDEKELLLFETVDLSGPDSPESCFPTFTPSPLDRYELMVTSPTGVHTLSFNDWVGQLEAELAAEDDTGVNVRLDAILKNLGTKVEHTIFIDSPEVEAQYSTAIAILDPSIGYFLVTSTPSNEPFAALLDIPAQVHPFEPDEELAALPAPPPREAYRKAAEFDTNKYPITLNQNIKAYASSIHYDLAKPVQYAPKDLQVMTEAHRILARQTHDIGRAAAELFRACERMREELRKQISDVRTAADKIDSITGEDEEDLEGENQTNTPPISGEDANDDGWHESQPRGKAQLELKIERAQLQNEVINRRVEELRRKMLRLGGAQLSAREAAFMEEVKRIDIDTRGFGDSILDMIPNASQASTEDPETPIAAPASPAQILKLPNSPSEQRRRQRESAEAAVEEDEEGDDGNSGELVRRLKQALELQQKLGGETKEAVEGLKRNAQEGSVGRGAGAGGYGDTFKRRKMEEVWALLERETDLVEAVMGRLKRLERIG